MRWLSRLTHDAPVRPRRRSARIRLTALYGGLFLVCAVILLAVTYLLVQRATAGASAFPTGATPPGSIAHLTAPLPVHPLQAAAQAGAHQQNATDLEQLLIQSGIALGIVGILALALGWFVAGRILRPLSIMTAAAQRISVSNLRERLNLQGPDDELKDLGDTLDQLFGRLEAGFEAQRRFAANASHELRTPLTAERTLLEVALDDPSTTPEGWRSTSQEVLVSNREQERLIDALLTLASSESGLDRHEPVDLSAMVARVVLARQTDADRLGLSVQIATRPAILDGEPILIERLVANLVDNALIHNIEGGRIDIATGSEEASAVLSVANTGPVIPPAEMDRLFEPFQRLDERRTRHASGHGLGLTIVRAIAATHGARVTAQAPPPGGLVISISFPPAITESPSQREGKAPQGHAPRRRRVRAHTSLRVEASSTELPGPPASHRL